jgi:hypothetical protein
LSVGFWVSRWRGGAFKAEAAIRDIQFHAITE